MTVQWQVSFSGFSPTPVKQPSDEVLRSSVEGHAPQPSPYTCHGTRASIYLTAKANPQIIHYLAPREPAGQRHVPMLCENQPSCLRLWFIYFAA